MRLQSKVLIDPVEKIKLEMKTENEYEAQANEYYTFFLFVYTQGE